MKQIQTIQASGKELPISYGMAALAEFLESEGLKLADLGEISERFQLTTVINLIRIGLKHGARKAGKDFSLTIDDVADLLDDSPDIINEAMELFAASMPMQGNGQQPTQTAAAKVRKVGKG